jgi:Tfp pilus assembly protein PilF
MARKLHVVLLFFSLSLVIFLSHSTPEAVTVDSVSNNQTSLTENKSAAIYVGKGLALYNMSNYQEALSWFDKALAIDPNSTSAIVNKARAYYR